ncbi:MAG: methionine synthase [Candidatus Omnitrophica bacterium]|nr:methionine synthase [Candidatus Omnitrophota bacterium]
MDKLHFFDQISIETPFEAIYSRLGYRQGITRLTGRQKEEIDSYINEAARFLKPKGVGRRVEIVKRKPKALELSGGIIFESSLLVSVFPNASELILIGATSGSDIITAIENCQKQDLTRGVVFDAAASETVDLCLEWICDYFNRLLKRENKQLTAKRISCGYGDFRLENQKIIYELLELEKLGVSLSDKYILKPEKSVTAVVGVIELK